MISEELVTPKSISLLSYPLFPSTQLLKQPYSHPLLPLPLHKHTHTLSFYLYFTSEFPSNYYCNHSLGLHLTISLLEHSLKSVPWNPSFTGFNKFLQLNTSFSAKYVQWSFKENQITAGVSLGSPLLRLELPLFLV